MRIAVVQFAPEFGLPDYNLDRALHLARTEDADLYVLPELCASGYQFRERAEVERYAEEIPDGPTSDRLLEFAWRNGAFIVAGVAERSGERLFNTAVLVGPDGLVGTYRKTHLFLEEKDHFDPGDTGFQVLEAGELRVGLMICFDWIFPEAARVLALKGADCLVVPSNLVLPWCQRAMVIRSVENRVYSVVANRWGIAERRGMEPLTFTGHSQIAGPDGSILASLGGEEDGIAVASIDPAEARDKHVTPRNDVFADRRPAFYQALLP
jgi:predicted amidohydrolase